MQSITSTETFFQTIWAYFNNRAFILFKDYQGPTYCLWWDLPSSEVVMIPTSNCSLPLDLMNYFPTNPIQNLPGVDDDMESEC